jgi:two-component system, sensor histidine kinase LadS
MNLHKLFFIVSVFMLSLFGLGQIRAQPLQAIRLYYADSTAQTPMLTPPNDDVAWLTTSILQPPPVSAVSSMQWIHFSLQNDTEFDQEIFVEFDIFWAEITLFEPKLTGYQKSYSGATYFESNRDVWLRNRNIFDLEIRKGETRSFYALLHRNKKVLSEPFSAGVQFKSIKAVDDEEQAQLLLSVFLAGCLFMLFSYNVFIWLSTKSRAYFYYLIIILINLSAILMNSGLMWQWLHSPLVFSIDLFLSFCYGFIIVLFTTHFLDTQKNARYWHIFLRFLLIPVCLMVIPAFWGDLLLANNISSLVGLITLVSAVLVGITVSIRHRQSPHYFFTMGFLFFALGVWSTLLASLGVVEFNLFTQNSIQICSVAEASMFALALADRMNVLKRENEAKQVLIIKQLEENTALQTKVNHELEQKVQERTQEIRTQKDEIEEKNVELEQLTEEIISQRDSLAEQNKIIASKNEKIVSSINYAKHIQSAILPDEATFVDFFGKANYFVYYQPRDIVSGDFYWLNANKDRLLIAVADCTGHGVPGALMSMIGVRLLDSIVEKNSSLGVAQILDALNQLLLKALRVEQTNARDGMDIAILEIGTEEIYFAGAGNSLLYSTGSGELHEIKGDKKAIGGDQVGRALVFKQYTLIRQSGMTLYLSSDGYKDQFGGQDNSKLMAKRLKTYLQEVNTLPMPEQGIILENKFQQWKSYHPQTDDVCVIGIAL